MSGSSLVTNGNIVSAPANDLYRDNFEGVFGNNEDSDELVLAYRVADTEYENDGLIGLDTAAKIIELGGDISNYE